MPIQSRSRLFRDPIHGDIRLGSIQTAIIDTPIFQRLRYVKQNGLLHFVFTGAVHTRFAHSIGTAHVATRVFDNLARDMRNSASAQLDGKSIQYIEQVFVTAALLHDCGHSAFSHSIEGVTVNGHPVFRSLHEMATEWSTDTWDLRHWLESATSNGLELNEDHISHEEIGLLLISYLNNFEHVRKAVVNELGTPLYIFLSDVQSLIDDRLSFSEDFSKCGSRSTQFIPFADTIENPERASQLHEALSSLISGTLDVDRMDYLLRDSHYTGTTYGVYDYHTLVNSIRLGVWQGPAYSMLVVCLRERACSAFDDFLWGRYQLFNQVINHKTNVMLNALLGDAIEEVIDSQKASVSRPKDMKDFLSFTDEFIMSQVIAAALNEDKDRLYKKVLVDRDLPIYLHREEITSLYETNDSPETSVNDFLESKKEAIAAKYNMQNPETIRSKITESKFLKYTRTPHVIREDKGSGAQNVHLFSEHGGYQLYNWSATGPTGQDEESAQQANGIPATVIHAHFFVDKINAGF